MNGKKLSEILEKERQGLPVSDEELAYAIQYVPEVADFMEAENNNYAMYYLLIKRDCLNRMQEFRSNGI